MGFQNQLVPQFISTETRSNDDPVASGGTRVFDFFAPPGWMYQAFGIDLVAPGIGSTGTHRFDITTRTTTDHIRHLTGASDFGDDLSFQFSHWRHASNNAMPPDGAGALAAVQRLIADSKRAIRIAYHNNTDVGQPAGEVVVGILAHQLRIDETAR